MLSAIRRVPSRVGDGRDLCADDLRDQIGLPLGRCGF
jgi:hypothetical protein